MSAPLMGRCPGCKKTVRLPAEAAGKTVRCKQCGLVCEVKPTEKWRAQQAEAKKAAPPAIPVAQPAIPAAQAAATVVPAPTHWAPAPPGDAWSAIADEAFGASNTPAIRPRYKKRGGGLLVLIALFLLGMALIGTGVAGYMLIPRIKDKLKERELARNGNGNGTESNGNSTAIGNPDKPIDATGNIFPRRMLGISINNYIFANPTSYGHDARNYIKRSFGQTLEKMANRYRVPTSQVFELSDGMPGGKSPPPLKPILEQTLSRFCETSRPQDRVIIVLCGHTVEIEKKPYLVPLEGDLDDVASLIPLEWVMQQLDKCPAQQKVLIADFNRFDKARGKERPSGGKLSASAEALLKNPPKGVQVWSACSAGQYSYEFDDYYDFNGQGIKGGAFLCLFSVAFLQGGGLKGIQKPEDPLPIEALAAKVNADMVALSQDLPEPEPEDESTDEKKDVKKDDKKEMKDDKKEMKPAPAKRKALQTPFFVGEMKGEAVAFDAKAPPPAAFKIPTPKDVYATGVMPRDDLKKLVDAFMLPSIKPARSSESSARIDQILPFTVAAMKDYRSDIPLATIKANKDKYPLRFAVIEAIEKLRALDSSDIALPTQLTEADRSDASKGNLARLQRGPARVMQGLEELQESLAKAAEERKEEKSKYWQATLDYVLAQVKSRYVYVHEYTSVIGQVRKDALPDLNKRKGQSGWRLASSERLASDSNEIKDMAKEARKIYAKIAKEHPGTPWEVLARRERFTALGLLWEVYGEATREQSDAVANN